MSDRIFHLAVLIVALIWLPSCSSQSTVTPANRNATSTTSTATTTPSNTNEVLDFRRDPSQITPASHLNSAKNYMRGSMSEYDLSQAREHLEQIPKDAPEHKEAKELLAHIETIQTSKPQPSESNIAETILHVENNKRIPVAVTQDDFYATQDAIFMNDEYEKALALLRNGRIFMIENDSSVIVLEPFGYLTKIKVKKSGRIGWVKSSWIRQELLR